MDVFLAAKTPTFRIRLASLLLGLTMMVSARAADWAQWGGGDQRNMTAQATGLPASFVPGVKVRDQELLDLTQAKNILWGRRLGTVSFGSPTVAGGKLLVGTNAINTAATTQKSDHGTILCLDALTGKLLWSLIAPRDPLARNLSESPKDGICAAATIDGDRAYVTGVGPEILCMDMNAQGEGKIIWRFNTRKELHDDPHDAMACAPLIHDGVLYTNTGNGVNHGHKKSDAPNAPCFIALDKLTGKLLAVDDEKIATRIFHGSWSSPTLGMINGQAQIIYGGGDGVCYGFEPIKPDSNAAVAKLKKIWSFDANFGNTHPYNTVDGPSEIIATPVCVNNRVYFTIGQDWTHKRGNGHVYCVDATKTGDITQSGKVWDYDQIGRSISTPSVVDDCLYLADLDGKVHCIDIKTGKANWVFETKAPIWSSQLVADGKVFVGTSKGTFFILAAGREMKQLAEIKMQDAISGAPAVANNVLYVMTYKSLHAIAMKN